MRLAGKRVGALTRQRRPRREVVLQPQGRSSLVMKRRKETLTRDRSAEGLSLSKLAIELLGSFPFHVWVYFNSSVAMPTLDGKQSYAGGVVL